MDGKGRWIDNVAVDVLCESFYDYPFMRFVIGSAGDNYGPRLRTLIGFFTVARFINNDLVLAATTQDGEVVGVTNVTVPGERTRSSALARRREDVWQALGEEVRARYEAYGRSYEVFRVEASHYHVNMIGVRRSHAGRGVGRRLLDAVHDASRRDPRSCGVTLTTKDPANVPLYEHLGYANMGTARIADTLETWGFFRPDD